MSEPYIWPAGAYSFPVLCPGMAVWVRDTLAPEQPRMAIVTRIADDGSAWVCDPYARRSEPGFIEHRYEAERLTPYNPRGAA